MQNETSIEKPVVSLEQKNTQTQNKKSTKVILWVLLGLCACVFIFSAGMLAKIWLGYMQAQDEYASLEQIALLPQEPPAVSGLSLPEKTAAEGIFVLDYEKMISINSDFVGWIDIKNAGISYPIVKGSNNDYYLYHTFQKKRNKSGAIFMDYRNSADFQDYNTILYGHNMQDGSMFEGLKKFADPQFLQMYPDILIYTQEGVRTFRVFSAKETDVYDTAYKRSFPNEDTFLTFLNKIGAPLGTKNILTLSTCVNEAVNDKRFVVMAAEVF